MFFAYFASLFENVNFLCQSMDMPIYEGDGWVKRDIKWSDRGHDGEIEVVRNIAKNNVPLETMV